MELFDNDATASMTDRERRLLQSLARCQAFLAALNGSQWIKGDDTGSVDMRQRSVALQRSVSSAINADAVTRRAVYADA